MSSLFDFNAETEDQPSIDGLAAIRKPRSGFRLHKLEVYNWGTFDSTQEESRGHVYSVRPAGETTLLIGENGSGKSTLVDALLTLLVHRSVRNYNVAAGAGKRERDERTYIRGAFGRLSRDSDGRADVQFLRPDGSSPSVLLACFRSETSGRAFTLAQVLHLDAEGQAKKVFCFADGEKSIAADCAQLAGTAKLKRQLEDRGFRVTTSYQEYHQWFRKATGVRPKSMDMFNQTVAVKDVQRLTDFIRSHMLEAKPWNERVERLLRHFTELGDAHASLLQARRQLELLEPVADLGKKFVKQTSELARAELLVEAIDAFFRHQTIEVLTPQRTQWTAELQKADEEKLRLDREWKVLSEECRSLKNEIDRAGGDRLREIPHLIQQQETEARAKQDASRRYHAALTAAGLDVRVKSSQDFEVVRDRLPVLATELDQQIMEADRERDDHKMRRAELVRAITDDERELEALKLRQGNLPVQLSELRRRMAEELGLAEKELPFAAELIAVKPTERGWESSIEMILRPFALSLLVPERHYALVSRYVNNSRLADDRGHGQRMTYLKVGTSKATERPLGPDSLTRKLDFQTRHPLVPWVRGELEQRFDYRCCNSIEEFQAAPAPAMTSERHVKRAGDRHEKDDRDRAVDPRAFVLGWDNREKCRLLSDAIRAQQENLSQTEERIRRIEETLENLRQRRTAVRAASEFNDFHTFDFSRHEAEIAQLQLERQALEEGNEAVRVLKTRLAEHELREKAIRERLEQLAGDVRERQKSVQEAEKLISNAQAALDRQKKDGSLERHLTVFENLSKLAGEASGTAGELVEREREVGRTLTASRDRLRERIDPVQEKLVAAMNRFLRECPEERHDLEPMVRYLDGFLGLLERIQAEDLPRYEGRFKDRLNEKVTQEIGLLNAELTIERTQIEERISLLNQSLQQLEYRPGTHMQLQARDVRDPEIVVFRDALKECLSRSFEGSPEADEARFLRIEKLVSRLRDDERWRTKVTDVRRWFDFAARETDDATGEERSYHEDSTGQSGGEKAKLAFTILVAAIAYQYDIGPDGDVADRFRFVVVDEMFSKVDDQYSEYALRLFEKFGLQLLIVAPLDAKARVTEPYVGCYLHVYKDEATSRSDVFSMTAREFDERCGTDSPSGEVTTAGSDKPVRNRPR